MKQRIFSLLLAFVGFVSAFAQTTAERYRMYIEQYAQMAQEQQKEHGVPASITLAQGLLESAAGQSELATKANNHFGIKCGGEWSGASYRHDDETRNECFRKYRHVEESYTDHSLFLKRKRYESLFTLAVTDYKGWAHGLKRCGYATDPNYANKLIKIIETYDLACYSVLDDKKAKENKRTKDTKKTKHPKVTPVQTVQQDVPVQAVTTLKERDAVPTTIQQPKPTMGSVDLVIEHEVLRNNGKRYVIAREGDTFLSIAYEFNMYDSTLRRYNDIRNPRYELQPGDKVYLQKKRKKAPRKYAIYRVRKNDNIWQIAQDMGMQLQTIYDLNGIPTGENVSESQKLCLR